MLRKYETKQYLFEKIKAEIFIVNLIRIRQRQIKSESLFIAKFQVGFSSHSDLKKARKCSVLI